jgi:hypothetical protein
VNRRQLAAVVVGLLAMAAAAGPPVWVRATGSEHTLAVLPVDPLSFFRGNYVDLRYDISLPSGVPIRDDPTLVYLVFADERPGRLLRVSTDKPELADGEFCVRGRQWGSTLDLPNLEQIFLGEERARTLGNLADYLAVLDVNGSCRAVLVDLERR